jgi:hypothetical protein
MISYQKHLQHLSGAAATATLRRPIFRSSAIFPVFHTAGMSTRICFLGYWMIKRKLAEVHAIVTLRSADGTTLYRSNKLIALPKTYRIELIDYLHPIGMEDNSEFMGSIEVEFFSAHDLVFAYPAAVVNYYGPTFSTVVHTSQRIFNDAEDRNANLETMVPESGFTLYADSDREPFFSFINGFERVVNGKITMQFFNQQQEVLLHEITIPELQPYQTTLVYPCETIDLRNFLSGKPGTAKITFDTKWVFPRIIAGNYQHSLQALSVTHTYYDCSEANAPSDYWREAEQSYHPASLMIPLSVEQARTTNVCFYPIYSPSEFNIDIEIYSSAGALLGTAFQAKKLISPSKEMHFIELKALCESLHIDTNQPLGAKVIAYPAEGSRLPTRIKIGLDFGINSNSLPCNICKNMDVFNPQLENKKGTFHWAPVLADQEDSVVWFVNGNPMKDYRRTAELTLHFYREDDESVLTRQLTLAPNGAACIRLSVDEELRAFFRGKVGWYTATSSNPYFQSYYLCEHSSGVVGGDHDF